MPGRSRWTKIWPVIEPVACFGLQQVITIAYPRNDTWGVKPVSVPSASRHNWIRIR